MAYQVGEFYNGKFVQAELTEAGEDNPIIRCYINGEHGNIGGTFWLLDKEGTLERSVRILRSYGVTDEEISGLYGSAQCLIGKPCRFVVKERQWQDRKTGKVETKLEAGAFFALGKGSKPPSERTQDRLKSLLQAGLSPEVDDDPTPF